MLRIWFFITLQISLSLTAPLRNTQRCHPDILNPPNVFGLELLGVQATEVYNYTTLSLRPGSSDISYPVTTFCNVSIMYTHPGWSDKIHVSVWLPVQGWNGRLQALGGGGYSAGLGSIYLNQAVSTGYAAIETDAGHNSGLAPAQSPSTWALTSPGNVNLYLLEDFASRALDDMTILGKSITQTYYESPIAYSYFLGCSGGGRQGLEIAQRYPESYDGILAVAPAIAIEKFIPAAYWGMQVMKNLDYYPPPCEIEGFTQEAISVCDALDGLEDGIISDSDLCDFSAHDIVGKSFSCDGTTLQYTSAGAEAVDAAWKGTRALLGNTGWYGLSKDASLTSVYLATRCPTNSTSHCTASSSELISGWLKYFIAKDPDWNVSTMTDEEFFEHLKYSATEYGPILGSSSPDLSSFYAADGKMVTWHGTADEVIPINGAIAYYQRVLAMDANTPDYYRFFEAPGVGHCIGGNGPIPNSAFDALVAWVEAGEAPRTLTATSQNGNGETRPLCPYPQKQRYFEEEGLSGVFKCSDMTAEPAKEFLVQGSALGRKAY